MVDFAHGKKAWSISQRSGLRFPYNEMVIEPGTNIWLHRSETDGKYNRVDHPQGNVKAPPADRMALEKIFIDGRYSQNPTFLSDENNNPIVFIEMFGVELYIIT